MCLELHPDFAHFQIRAGTLELADFCFQQVIQHLLESDFPPDPYKGHNSE